MVAALNLGAAEAIGIDVDRKSVDAARALLTHYNSSQRWIVEHKNLFDFSTTDRRFPIVYSWGVLHHTGAMDSAIRHAASLVEPGGSLAIALYRRTTFCRAWAIEKRLYASAPSTVQAVARGVWKTALCAKMLAGGANPLRQIAAMQSRGMDWHHDVHDWLGGYPYESAEPSNVLALLESLGFSTQHFDPGSPRLGLFGSCCNEYVGHRL